MDKEVVKNEAEKIAGKAETVYETGKSFVNRNWKKIAAGTAVAGAVVAGCIMKAKNKVPVDQIVEKAESAKEAAKEAAEEVAGKAKELKNNIKKN